MWLRNVQIGQFVTALRKSTMCLVIHSRALTTSRVRRPSRICSWAKTSRSTTFSLKTNRRNDWIEQVVRSARDKLQQAAARSAGNDGMKFEVERDQILGMGRRMARAIDILFQKIELGVGNAQCSRGGDCRLDAVHRLPQFQKAHLLQHHGRLHARSDLAVARRADEETFSAGAAAEHPILLQHPDRLAHRSSD